MNYRIDEAIKMVADGEIDSFTCRDKEQGITSKITIQYMSNFPPMVMFRQKGDDKTNTEYSLSLNNWQAVEKAMSFEENEREEYK